MANKSFLFTIILAVLLVSCTGETETETLRGATAPFDPNNTPVRWSATNLSTGIDLKVADSFINSLSGGDIDGNGRNPFEQMMHEWNNATTSYTFFKDPAQTTTNKDYSSLSSYKNDGEFGIYKSTGWFSNVSSSALAVAQYFGYRRNAGTSSEYIELNHADIIVNYRDHLFSHDSSDTASYDLTTVILHELGHFIGLAHEYDYGSDAIMLPYLGRSESKRTLRTIDKDNLLARYNISSLSALHATKTIMEPAANEGEEVHGVIELRSDGKCHHYINGKLTHVH